MNPRWTGGGKGYLFFFFFCWNRIPSGTQCKRSQGTQEIRTCPFDSAPVKRAAQRPGLASQSQHRKCQPDLSVRGTSFTMAGRELPPSQAQLWALPAAGNNGINPRGCAVLGPSSQPSSPTAGGDQQAARGSQALPWTVATRLLLRSSFMLLEGGDPWADS